MRKWKLSKINHKKYLFYEMGNDLQKLCESKLTEMSVFEFVAPAAKSRLDEVVNVRKSIQCVPMKK